MSAKTLCCMKTVGLTLFIVTFLGFGASCSRKAPDSDKKDKQQNTKTDVFLKEEKKDANLGIGTTGKQENLVFNAREIKVEPNDVKISRSAQIFLWQSGAKKELDGAEPWVTKLQHDCEALFISADDILKEAITKWTLERVRAGEAIELLYRKEQHFKVRTGTKSMHVDGLLIPLKPLHGNSAVIYHRLGSYSAGPLINTEGKKITDHLRQMLVEHAVLAE